MDNAEEHTASGESLSRRRFLTAIGLGATAASIREDGLLSPVHAADPPAAGPLGPGPVPIELNVNGQALRLVAEPRVTLLDALRSHPIAGKNEPIDVTGPKRVCDRASCGACTVLLDGRTAYACTLLAIDVQGRNIRTVEGLEKDGKLHVVQEEIVHKDGLMCGYCTPGFTVAAVALLERNPSPTEREIRRALDGNICRCGTQCRMLEAVQSAALRLQGK